MGKRFAIISTVAAAWILIPAAAHAFEQQTPAAPAPEAPVVVPANPALTLDQQAKAPETEKKNRGIKVPGLGKVTVPKLNFGLDLMYGSQEPRDTELGFSPDPGNEGDVTIMGKVKRRF